MAVRRGGRRMTTTPLRDALRRLGVRLPGEKMDGNRLTVVAFCLHTGIPRASLIDWLGHEGKRNAGEKVPSLPSWVLPYLELEAGDRRPLGKLGDRTVKRINKAHLSPRQDSEKARQKQTDPEPDVSESVEA